MHRLRLSSLGAFVSRASLRTNRLSHEMKNRTTRKLITGPEVVMCTVTVDGRFCHSLDPTLLGLRASGLQASGFKVSTTRSRLQFRSARGKAQSTKRFHDDAL